MASVTIQNVWKYYGKTEAVKDLNLACKNGEFLCILGPSGCGKSSTLRMLAGLEHISSGDILFDERRVNDIPPKDRDIAMVFENYALYPHKTVYDNMANPLRLRGMDKATIDQRVQKAAKLLEIGHLLDRRPVALSGGQKQRTAIGRAIVREPALFLFDEPIAHLDAKLRAHMRVELKIMQRELGTTMIYVTHDQLEAISMADRVAVMHEGVLQQFGPPQEVYHHPANQWVAGFVGEPPMNFLECELAEEGEQVMLRHSNFTAALLPEQSAKIRERARERQVTLGIRPEEIAIFESQQPDSIAGQVMITESLGGDVLIDVEVGQSKVLVKAKPSFRGGRGDDCYMTMDRNRWHIFPKETGEAIF